MNDLYNPDYLQHLCKKYQLFPSKKYGQNFLVNPAPIEKMLEVAALTRGDTVVEVGPGFGVLTLALGAHAKKVCSFEIEKKLQSYWEEQIKKHPTIEVVWGNVLKQFDAILVGAVHELPLPHNGAGKLYKVVANLPYQITSPVIRLFLENEFPPDSMVLMVQKEVAQRVCASVGQMSVLAVAVQFYGEAEYVMTVPRTYFWPEPKVDSAIIKIKIKPDTTTYSSEFKENFFKVVKAGFSSRRKMLCKNLLSFLGKENKGKLETLYKEVGLSQKVRAQEVSVEQWKIISSRFKIYPLI